jgi:hypothetical protein
MWPFHFAHPALFGHPIMACYEANFKSNGDKQSPCFEPFSVGHAFAEYQWQFTVGSI